MGLVLPLSHWFGLVFGHKIIKKLGKDLWPAHTAYSGAETYAEELNPG